MTKLHALALLLNLFLGLFAFGQNDWMSLDLKANPKSVKHIQYNVVEHFGEIKKIEIIKGVNYKFNTIGFFLSKENYGTNGAPINQMSFEYTDLNRIKQKTLRDNKGKLLNRVTFDYNDNNKPTYKSIYGFDGALTARLAYKYEKKHKRLIKMLTFDSKGEMKEIKDYSYRKRKQLKKIETRNPKNNVIGNAVVYDKNDRIIENLFFDVMGDLRSKVLFDYKDNQMIKSTFYKEDELVLKKDFFYNNLGFLIKEIDESITLNKTDVISFSYDFDKKVNWVKKTKYINSVPVLVEERTIVYY
jgi:hypothetical protein